MMRDMARVRGGMRTRDIAESKHLLWELVTHEPTVLQCFGVVEATCMAQGLFCKIDGERCGDEFQRFLDRHYMPFCRQAVRAFFTYGFVPWVVRRLEDGDDIPEVLCNGTFHWCTEIPSRDAGAISQQINPGLVAYKVQITAALEVKDDDVKIFVHTPPALDVSVNSMLYATVPSPLSHVLTDYKNLRQAQIRRSHADAWNTTAKLICSFKPTIRVQEDPGASLMDFADDSYYQPGMHLGLPAFAPLNATNLWTRDAQIKKQFEQGAVSTTHQPDVFTLPRDHDVAQQPMLNPCEDLDFLMNKFQHDVCSIMGVPEEMVHSQARGGQETVRKTMASGRIFSSNMVEVCRQLQELLRQVYKHIYGKDNVEFILLPMPRLEVESVADMKILFEIGALTPDMSLQLSHIMLGEDIENKRRRIQLERGANGAQQANGGANGDKRTMMTPDELQAVKGGKTGGGSNWGKKEGKNDKGEKKEKEGKNDKGEKKEKEKEKKKD